MEQAQDHLRRNRITAVFEELDGGMICLCGAKRNRTLAETVGNDHSNWRSSLFDCDLRSCRGVFRLFDILDRIRPSFHHQRTFLLQTLRQPSGGAAAIFIHNEHMDLGRRVAASAEDNSENAEEDNWQNETQGERAPIATQGNHGGPNNGEHQSRNSLPVK